MSNLIKTEDNMVVQVGDIVFDYYNLRISLIISEPDDQGWFYLKEMYRENEPDRWFKDGSRGWQRELLNGERICTLGYARSSSMYSKYVTDAEVDLAKSILLGVDD